MPADRDSRMRLSLAIKPECSTNVARNKNEVAGS
jgi:hypothetical protein